jgi:hypothetical protein
MLPVVVLISPATYNPVEDIGNEQLEISFKI